MISSSKTLLYHRTSHMAHQCDVYLQGVGVICWRPKAGQFAPYNHSRVDTCWSNFADVMIPASKDMEYHNYCSIWTPTRCD